MASVWIVTRTTRAGEPRYRVEWRVGGRESATRYGGSFRTKREAVERKKWLTGELAAQRVPDLRALAEQAPAATIAEAAKRWRASRRDVRESTAVQHRTSVDRFLRILSGRRRVDEITAGDVADLVAKLAADGYARESIRKSVTVLAMILDHEGVQPNPARDRVRVRLPREEPEEVSPPEAAHVENVARLLAPSYQLALLVLDATGCRVGELEAARVGDVDEHRQGWLIRASVSKTRRPRWVELPDDLWAAVSGRLPPRDDRDPTARLFGDATADRLRTALSRACKAAGVPVFSPHDLRHRRISLLHKRGVSWAEIGDLVGQRSRLVTADTYSHVLLDPREIDRSALLSRAE